MTTVARTRLTVLIVLLLGALLSACTSPTAEPPTISDPMISDPTPQEPGKEVGISVDVSSAGGVTLTYTWNADGGEIVRGQGSPAITYRVPEEPGTYNVRVKVEWDGQSVEKVTAIQVEGEAIAPTATMIDLSGDEKLGASEDNPIIWSFVPSGEMEQVAAGAQEVADLLHDETGLYFDTNVATEYAGVIGAMCSDPPEAHMASLATFSYVLANERCGVEAELVAVRYGSPKYNGQLITQADSNISSISDLEGKTFCRPDPLSTSGWIIPSLSMRAEGVDPESDLAEIVDAGSHDAVVAAVYNGDCDAGATYVDARGTIEEDNPDVMEKVVVFHVTADIPNDGVQFIPEMDEELKMKIVDGLLSISETEEGKAALDTAYGWAGLEKHGDEFYDPFRQVLQASGINIEELQE